jgi:hypothetical protein
VSTINQAAREIQGRIVSYGPGLAGKPTAPRSSHDPVRAASRGRLVTLDSDGLATEADALSTPHVLVGARLRAESI